MSDKQKVIVSLTLASETCTAALTSLRETQSHESGPTLTILHKDLNSLLTLIHTSATKCSLSLKPSQPTYPAALSPLKDLTTHTAALTHNAQLFDPDVHGATLTKEVLHTVQDVIEAIRALIQTFLALQTNAGSGTGQAGEEYMVRTGTLHDLINTAKSAKGISKDNKGAVRKKWIDDRGSLEDGFREVGEMIEDAEDDDEDEDEEFADEDGWDELGLGKGRKMEQDELERTKKVHGLIRLTTLLHKRILLDLLTNTSTQPISNTSLDALLLHSNALVASSDDLVSTLYTPQNPASIRTELTPFVDVIRALQSGLDAFFPLEAQVAELSIAEGKTKGKSQKDIKKWFDTCFEQIYKSSTAFLSALPNKSLDAP